jgi:hypothetical protein
MFILQQDKIDIKDRFFEELERVWNKFPEHSMFPHRNIRKFSLTFLHGKTQNQIGHILIGGVHLMFVQDSRLWYWQLSSGSKFRERLAVSKQVMQGVHMERFNLKKLNKVKGKTSIGLKSQIGLQLQKT